MSRMCSSCSGVFGDSYSLVSHMGGILLCHPCHSAHVNRNKSHGMDFEDEVSKKDQLERLEDRCPYCCGLWIKCKGKCNAAKSVDEDKAWNEFGDWAHEQFDFSDWNRVADFIRIGLLIEYLKTKANLKDPDEIIHLSNINVEYLEKEVKSLKPVDEVEDRYIKSQVTFNGKDLYERI